MDVDGFASSQSDNEDSYKDGSGDHPPPVLARFVDTTSAYVPIASGSLGPERVLSGVGLGDNRYTSPNYEKLPGDEVEDWKYVMRRTMQEVIPNVFLGPYASATKNKLNDMREAGLTAVVCVRQALERNVIRPNHPGYFKYLVVEISDDVFQNMIPHFKEVNKFIDDELAAGGRVLVHGSAGISRSGALVIAYVMSRYGVGLNEAFHFVQSRRFCVNPNEGFMSQLREYEPIYRAAHVVPKQLPDMDASPSSSQRSSCKRPFEDDDDCEDDMDIADGESAKVPHMSQERD